MGAPSLKPMPGIPGSSALNPLGRLGPPGMHGSMQPPGFGGGHSGPSQPIGHSGQVIDRTDPQDLAQFKQGFQQQNSPMQQAMTQRMLGSGAPVQAQGLGFGGLGGMQQALTAMTPQNAQGMGAIGPNPFANHGIPPMMPQASMPPLNPGMGQQ